MLVSIVIPIYNEEKILRSVIERLTFELANSFPYDYEIILCENGSKDNTYELAKELSVIYPKLRVYTAGEPNYGKALKTGIIMAKGECIIGDEIDIADVDFYRRALFALEEKKCAMVIGSKRMSESKDNRPWLRRVATASITGLLKLVFGLKVSDTHGLKAMRRSAVLPVVEKCVTEKDLFASELVIRAERDSLAISEIPIVIQENRKTPISIVKRVPNVLKNIFRLWWVLQTNRAEAYLFLGTIFAFFLISLYGFPDTPPPWFDEGVNLGIAKTFVQDGIFSLRLAPGEYVINRPLMITTNYPVIFPIIIMFSIFGIGLIQAKIVMLLFLAGFLVAAYTLMSGLFSTRAARFGLALLVSFLPLYGNGLGGGLGEVPGLMYLFIGLIILHKQKKLSDIFWAGLFFGLAAATKVFYLTFILPIIFGEIWHAFAVEKSFPWKRWSVLFAGATVPLFMWFFILFPNFWQKNEFTNAIRYYSNPYQVEHTVLSNLKRFVTESTPVHFMVLVFLYIFYLIFTKAKKSWSEAEIILVGCVLVTMFVYMRGSGWYRYFLPAHLIMLMLTSVSVIGIEEKFKNKLNHKNLAPIFLLALISVQTIQLLVNRSASEYYYPDTRVEAVKIEQLLNNATDVTTVNKPEIWFLLENPNIKQYLQINPYANVGNDFFQTGNFPKYLVTGNPDVDSWLVENKKIFFGAYRLKERFGRYWVFELNNK